MFRMAGILALLAGVCGCTVERIHRDANAGLDYLRLSHGTRVDASSRWQFAPDTRVAVSEAAPAANGDWLGSAREGMGSVFGLESPAADEYTAVAADLDLIIVWPDDQQDSSDPMSVRVFLSDARTQMLIQTARLDLSPRWFSSRGAQTAHIRGAFREYVQGLISKH